MEIFRSAGYLNGWLQHTDRWAGFKQQWPEWHIQFAAIPTVERFDWRRKIIWIAIDAPDLEIQVVHSTAHLLYHQRHWSSRFTPREEDEADWYTRVVLAWGPDPLPVAEEAGR